MSSERNDTSLDQKSHSGDEEHEPSGDKMAEAEMASNSAKATEGRGDMPGTSSGTSGNDNIGGIDRLLQNHRKEIMFELRRLQLGDRPVTGQGNKEAVENFFSRSQTGEGATGEGEHRPENVTVEVSALIERRPVTSLLQSDRFRRNLESALHGALSSVPLPRPSVRRPARTVIAERNDSGTASSTTPSAASTTPNTVSPANTSTPSQQQQQQQYSHPQDDVSSNQQNNRHPTPQTSPAEPQLYQEPAHARRQYVPDEPPTGQQNQRGLRLVAIQQALDQAHRDEVIADISELVQQQLVTSSLEGVFRNRLEHLMTEHLNDTETDGQRVQQFIQNLPPSHTVRNDFSHLGINAGAFSDDFDEISVISATATVAARHAQINPGISREMAAIKAQLSEMRNMLQMSFDVQLDIQRAIRQEVAAAINDVIGERTHGDRPPSLVADSFTPSAATPFIDGNCVICLDKEVDSVLYKCGHMCLCYSCGMHLKARGAHCPLCRAPIRDIIRTYR
ncbi:hypothetical protein LSH36_356g06010 [Paralvinella palmiformis]|uniref:RING-type domain-containing protein n=1 Tax=Paralvinella palmiformis TaxID=53620 RepID=A0AAD9JEW4_9ANNE|nr:hypothetical protein LSH36_356g06010 [Paralvinella palmiformis]